VETVCIVAYYGKKIKTINQDAPFAVAKGMLLQKVLMPSWMNYVQFLLQERVLEGIEARESGLNGITSLKISFNNVLVIISLKYA
jgi:hypothetical protein